jgi:hypothetical protein
MVHLMSVIDLRMIIWAFCESVFTFVGTLSMNRLLAYLENPDASIVTPYVWVALILVVPVLMSMFMQQYFVNSIQLTANVKAALVQALYEKTLRVRISGASEDNEGEDTMGDRNRVGRINNLMSSDVYVS